MCFFPGEKGISGMSRCVLVTRKEPQPLSAFLQTYLLHFRTDQGPTGFWASAVLWQWAEKKQICPLLPFRAWECCFYTAQQTEQPLQRLLFTYNFIGGFSNETAIYTKAPVANKKWKRTKRSSAFHSYPQKAIYIRGRVNGAHIAEI